MNRSSLAGALFALSGVLALGRVAIQPASTDPWAVLVGVGSLAAAGVFVFGGRSDALATDVGRTNGKALVAVAALACFLGGAAYAVVS